MSCINVTSVQVLNNPATFTTPLQFEISFECLSPIQEDLQWSLCYVGAADTTEHDQVLETVDIGPVNVGLSRFVLEANPPDVNKIPKGEVLGVTVLLLSCSYKNQEFIRVGYYVNNDYSEPIEDCEGQTVLSLDKVIRKIIADQPRVTHFSIPWDSAEVMPEIEGNDEEGEILSSEGMSEEEEEEEDEEDEDEESDSLSDDMESEEGMNVEGGKGSRTCTAGEHGQAFILGNTCGDESLYVRVTPVILQDAHIAHTPLLQLFIGTPVTKGHHTDASKLSTSDLSARARNIIERELDLYRARTPQSRHQTERAKRALPKGVPSSFQAYDPYPVVGARARGSWLEDMDGNHYVDFNMGFGALFSGHGNPIIVEAIKKQLGDGTLFVTPCELNYTVAEEIKARFGVDLVRFTNSGTEATMDAIRVARGFTNRDKLVKLEGGYHGHHDEVMISTKPPLKEAGDPERPHPVPSTLGLTQAVLHDTVVVPYNNLESLEAALSRRDVAAFILEPVMENIGICLPDPGYLEGVRELCDQYGTILIFDEVKTGITAGWRGATGYFGVQPDLISLGKSIGGGYPLGAFGGRQELMDLITTGDVLHLGTYNGNPLVMTAAHATLRDVCTYEATEKAVQMNRKALDGCDAIILENSLPAHTVQLGAKGCITWSSTRVRNYRDYKRTNFDIAYAQWMFGINRGILLPPGLDEQWLISVMHTEEDCALLVRVFDQFVKELLK